LKAINTIRQFMASFNGTCGPRPRAERGSRSRVGGRPPMAAIPTIGRDRRRIELSFTARGRVGHDSSASAM
jgi:hypothetical protein